jgi:probable F420-dependent oxidoreductase
MRFGIHLPQYGHASGGTAIRRAAALAEELGFDDLWVSDHIAQPADQSYPSPHLFDPFLTLTTAAAVTAKIGLGTSVLVASQYHPVWLANATASLDALSEGRLRLAVGVGWSEAEFVALGQSFHDRGRRTDEILEILRGCWTSDPTTYHGAHYDLVDLRVLPKPAHPIDIWIGGSSEAAYRRAARFGSGFQLIGLKPEAVGDPIARLRRDHPEPAAFTISLRTGWDPLGMDPAEIDTERHAFERAGIQHVVAAPWRKDLESWLDSTRELARILQLG